MSAPNSPTCTAWPSSLSSVAMNCSYNGMATSGLAARVKEGRLPFFCAGVKGELADDQHVAANIGEGVVHQSVVVVEDAQSGDLAAEPLDVFGGVGVLDAEQHDEAKADFTAHLVADGDRGFARPLDDYPHVGGRISECRCRRERRARVLPSSWAGELSR